MQNKQQDFLKQRERLKYVTQNNIARKVLDPDLMIEQLISDKETFKFNLEPPLPYTIPKWLKVENNLVPAVYEQVWKAVKVGPTFQFCDTKMITHLFTTSGLPLDKLGYLWSLTNVNSPGFLTQQELYIMLALIALVQTGYHVNDIIIINSIHHPILPQLDYSFLKISVANPAINRNIRNNDAKSNNNILFNGFQTAMPSNSVPLHVKPLIDTLNSRQFPKNVTQSSSQIVTADSSKINFTPNTLANMRKFDVDVAFAIPERNKIDLDVNFDTKAPVAELNVDFPIPPSKVELKSVPQMTKTNAVALDPRKADFDIRNKNAGGVSYNFLNVPAMSNNLEPRSLDLPLFNEPVIVPPDEDEFTEFQSATLNTTDEYSDFQSASSLVPKYKPDNRFNNNLESVFGADGTNIRQLESLVSNCEMVSPPSGCKTESVRSSSKVESLESSSVGEEISYPKTSIEADKYDVFRALIMEPSKEEKVKSDFDDEDHEDDDDEEDEEFGEFYAATGKPNEVKRELSIKDKCLEACLRLLQEGLRIFSSISKEQIVKEVLSDEKGCRYFSQLKIIYDTSQRFQRQFESTHLNDAIQSTWAKLSKYTKYIANEDLLDEIPSEDDVDATPCKLCETKCDVNCVRYAGHNYHVTCINLFLHFVEDSEITTMLNI